MNWKSCWVTAENVWPDIEIDTSCQRHRLLTIGFGPSFDTPKLWEVFTVLVWQACQIKLILISDSSTLRTWSMNKSIHHHGYYWKPNTKRKLWNCNSFVILICVTYHVCLPRKVSKNCENFYKIADNSWGGGWQCCSRNGQELCVLKVKDYFSHIIIIKQEAGHKALFLTLMVTHHVMALSYQSLEERNWSFYCCWVNPFFPKFSRTVCTFIGYFFMLVPKRAFLLLWDE